MDKVRGYDSYYKTKQTNSSRPFVSQTFQKCTTNSIDSRLSRRVSRTSRTIVSHDYPHVLLKHGNATSSGSLIAREVDMDRKIHRRMMDARYYLENGVAHPFTTGSRAQRSFRLPLFSSSSSSSPAHLSSSLPDPYPSAPFQREREREAFSRPVSGIKIGRPSRTNVAQGGIIHLTRPLTCRRTRAREQKGRYIVSGSVATLDRKMAPRFRVESGE